MSQKIKTVPRWSVFIFDLFLVVCSIVISRFIRHNFSLEKTINNLPVILAIVIPLNGLLFYAFKTYSGIIRYTNFQDGLRFIGVNIIASITYTLISWYYYSLGPVFVSRATIVINFYTVTFALIGYRIVIRYIFKHWFNSKIPVKDKVRAAIYDASEQGLLIKRVITDYPQSHMKVVAFLDDINHKQGKVMEGLPIYNTDEATFKKLQQDQVELIVIGNKNIHGNKLSELVDKALAHSMKVQQVPEPTQWLNGQLDTTQLKDVNIEDLLERDVIKIDNEKIFFSLKNKKILVTGAAGSIGSELVRQLTAFKPSLIILCDMAESPLHEICLEIQERFPNIPIKPYIGDICDKVRMEHLFEIYDPKIIFHAAAYKHVPLMEDNPSVAVSNNVLGTKIIAELAVAHDVEKFVMVSTDKAVNPTNVMGASKRIAEIFTQSYFKHISEGKDGHEKGNHTKFITTRFGNVLGSNGSVIPRFKHQIEKGGPITVTHPDITRYFMTIPEACQLVIEAGVMGNGGEIFVFDMGEPVKIVDLAYKMIKLSGKEPSIDIDIVFTGLRPGEKLYEELLSTAENCMPTYHDKIMIAKVREYNFRQVEKKIETLIKCAQGHYTYETVSLMKDLVPEFISNNSSFESLDVQVKK